MMLKKRRTPEQLANADLLAEIKEARQNAKRSRIINEKYKAIHDEYHAYISAHPEYEDHGIYRWRYDKWALEHPNVTRSFTIRQQFIALNPERNRPISRATSDREIAEGILRYRRNKEWHGDADLITLGFWLTLTEEVDVLKMDADLLTAWLGNLLCGKARSLYENSPFKEVEI